ncbi:alpha/beta fold hydrolase [Mesorhizobium sp. CAU 1732]|uniref:alpha/beta hydrolase n=1 Tax=Mesorhizobium sp. CAU 1732 TaxID=3140358 RepID=UPI003261ABAA
MASFGYLLFRSAFMLAEQIAPRATGRVAFELFCRTPDPDRPTKREADMLRDSAAFMDEARHHHLRTRDGWVVAHDFGPPEGRSAPAVLVVHGWRSRTEHMRTLIEALRHQGFRVIALDLPGHGRSTGRRLNLALAVAAVRAAADWFGPFSAIVGHSFGGAVAVNAVFGSIRGIAPVEAKRLVLVAAPSSMPGLFEDFGRFLGLGTRTQMALAGQVERVAGHPLESFVAADQLRELRIETLAVHAPDDKEVSFESARQFEDAGDHVRLVRVPGRGHRRIIADAAIANQIAEFAVAGF